MRVRARFTTVLPSAAPAEPIAVIVTSAAVAEGLPYAIPVEAVAEACAKVTNSVAG